MSSLQFERHTLESLGFSVLTDEADELIAVGSRFYWDCFATLVSYIIVVKRVEHLTRAQIEADRESLMARRTELDPNPLPRGMQKGVAILHLYHAASADDDARDFCRTPPKPRFAVFFVPALRDDARSEMIYIGHTPIWGGIYYSKFRYFFGRLLEPEVTPEQEPKSVFGLFGLVFLLLAIAAPILFVLLMP